MPGKVCPQAPAFSWNNPLLVAKRYTTGSSKTERNLGEQQEKYKATASDVCFFVIGFEHHRQAKPTTTVQHTDGCRIQQGN